MKVVTFLLCLSLLLYSMGTEVSEIEKLHMNTT
jgi:hypothetical protein